MFETFIEELKMQVLTAITQLLDGQKKVEPKRLGIINREELKTDLKISKATITRWEGAGLKPYRPPMEGAKTVFYKVSDVLAFLGVE